MTKTLMDDLAIALDGKVSFSDTVFVGRWGIFESLSGSGRVECRDVYDKDIRTSIGTVTDSVETLANNFREWLDHPECW